MSADPAATPTPSDGDAPAAPPVGPPPAVLAGKVVLVTGGGSGIGRSICTYCAAAGASVVVTGPDDRSIDETASLAADEAARAGSGGRAVAVRTDVSSAEQVHAAVAMAVERFGGLDAMVHNATSRKSSEVGTISSITEADWDDHVAVSLDGAYHCAQAALPWLQQRGGRLVVMTSPAAMEGTSTLPAYAAVKGALRGLAKGLAIEWGPLGVTVAAVSPLAMSPSLANAYRENPALEARLQKLVPLGRVGEPFFDVAPVIGFLASDASRFVTGQTIVVDGGRFTTL